MEEAASRLLAAPCQGPGRQRQQAVIFFFSALSCFHLRSLMQSPSLPAPYPLPAVSQGPGRQHQEEVVLAVWQSLSLHRSRSLAPSPSPVPSHSCQPRAEAPTPRRSLVLAVCPCNHCPCIAADPWLPAPSHSCQPRAEAPLPSSSKAPSLCTRLFPPPFHPIPPSLPFPFHSCLPRRRAPTPRRRKAATCCGRVTVKTVTGSTPLPLTLAAACQGAGRRCQKEKGRLCPVHSAFYLFPLFTPSPRHTPTFLIRSCLPRARAPLPRRRGAPRCRWMPS